MTVTQSLMQWPWSGGDCVTSVLNLMAVPRSQGQKVCHPINPPQEKVQVFSSGKGLGVIYLAEFVMQNASKAGYLARLHTRAQDE